MDTIKISKRQALMVAHRGLSGLEKENSLAAFIAAGQRSYYGIETDVRKTKDGAFVLMHDASTARVSPTDITIEESTLEEISAVRLFGYDGKTPRADLVVPMLSDYIAACRRYDKTAVLELKSAFTHEELDRMCKEIEEFEYLEHVTFISFSFDNLVRLREVRPNVTVQFLTGAADCDKEALINRVAEQKFDLDVHHGLISREFVDACHKAGIKVNVWTVDDPDTAHRMVADGVDFITTNRLE